MRWNVHLTGQPEPFGQVIDRWTTYLDELGVEIVTEGAVLLHRRAGEAHTARVDVIDDDVVDHAGDQIKRAFAARARLVELGKPSDLLDEHVSLAGLVRLERELDAETGRPREAGALVQITEGMHLGVETQPGLLEIVGALDGTASLGDVVDQAARARGLSGPDAKRLRRDTLDLVRELLELGALRFA